MIKQVGINTSLYEEPRGDEREAAVLAVEAVVVGVEREVVQVEEPGNNEKSHFNEFHTP